MVVQQILGRKSMNIVATPSLEWFLNEVDQVTDYPFQGTFEEVKENPFVILHTSGSTGIPKPVFVTHGTIASNDAYQMIPYLGGMPTFIDYIRGKRLFLAFPMFHAANLGLIAISIYAGVTCVLPPPVPLTVDIIDKAHTLGNLQGSLLPPSMILEVYHNSEYLANMLQRLNFVAYVGGTLNKHIGNALSTKIKLITCMGTTEAMWYPFEVHDSSADWQYIPISPYFGHIFRPHVEGLSELIIQRNANCSLFQGVFSTFPKIDEYATSDLYERHPTNQERWRCCGRKDDIICFNNAEKLNPVTMETIISGHVKVKHAIIGGQGQFQASLLIEPKVHPASLGEAEQFINDIWPIIKEANQDCPAHGRILRSFVLLTNPEKPLPTTAKGTVQRFAALKLYADELNALYMPAALSTAQKQDEPTEPIPSISVPAKPIPELSRAGPEGQSEASILCLPAELDVRIEIAVHRLLHTILVQRLGPALIQMVSQICQPLPLQAKPTDLPNGHSNPPEHIEKQPMANGQNNIQAGLLSEGTLSNGVSPSYGQTIGPKASDSRTLKEYLYQILSDDMYLYGVTDDADLFECGLDSLQAVALVKCINSFLASTKQDATPIRARTVYENPSIKQLLSTIESRV